MNSRLAVGLAVGAGYLLGRTKKAKLAFAVGTVVLGRKLELSPQGVARLVTSQLQQNPQFKEIGDQLREDIRGVGHAATGALVNRQLSGLADRLHDRTLNVRDRTAGPVPHGDDDTAGEDRADRNEADRREDSEDSGTSGETAEERPRKRTASAPRKTAPTAKKAAPKKKTAKKTTTAKRAADAKKTSPAAGRRAPRRATGARGGRSRD